MASDGRRIGFVTRVQGADGLRLSQVKEGYGFEHVIPLAWVSDVDRYVFLNKSSAYVTANWETPGPHGQPEPLGGLHAAASASPTHRCGVERAATFDTSEPAPAERTAPRPL